MSSNFSLGRQVATSQDIPRLHSRGIIPLLFGSRIDQGTLVSLGACKGRSGWFVKSSADLDIDFLEPFLPRFAHRVVYPEIPDLIPSSSWHSSLCNLLSRDSWRSLSKDCFTYWEGCEECGSSINLECHEAWDYDNASGIQDLADLRSLCHECHKMQHLGLAEHRGELAEVLHRHAMVNRLFDHEIADLYNLAIEKWENRSCVSWILSFSAIPQKTLRLKPGVEWSGEMTLRSAREERIITTRVTNAHIDRDSKGLVLITA